VASGKRSTWQDALEFTALRLNQIRESKGAAAIGALGFAAPDGGRTVSVHQTDARPRCTENIDHRLAQADATQGAGARWLGMPVADITTLNRVLLVGCQYPSGTATGRATAAPGGQAWCAAERIACRRRRSAEQGQRPTDFAKPGDWLNGLAQIAKAMQEAGADHGFGCRCDCRSLGY
jgi:NADH-quinone oxidoreductase subunit G